MKDSSENLKAKALELKAHLGDSFVFDFNKDEILETLNKEIDLSDDEPSNIIKTFRTNIESIISTSQLPIYMSFERTIKLMYDEIYLKENILSIKYKFSKTEDEKGKKLEEELNKRTKEKANEEFNDKIQSTEGSREFWFHSLIFLRQCSENGLISDQFLTSSKELINQVTLLTWSSLEILLRDIFVYTLNTFPNKTEVLFNDSNLKSKFGIKSIPTEKLIEYNFNLNGKMGDILIENFDFSNIDLIRSIYDCLFNDKNLNEKLKDNEIWKLYNRRNLIVHRGSIVDSKYLSKTDDCFQIGEKMFIKPYELKVYIQKTIDIALEL